MTTNSFFGKLMRFFGFGSRKIEQVQNAGDNSVCYQCATSEKMEAFGKSETVKLLEKEIAIYRICYNIAHEGHTIALAEFDYLLDILERMGGSVACPYLDVYDTAKRCPYWSRPEDLKDFPEDASFIEWQDAVFGDFKGPVRCATSTRSCMYHAAKTKAREHIRTIDKPIEVLDQYRYALDFACDVVKDEENMPCPYHRMYADKEICPHWTNPEGVHEPETCSVSEWIGHVFRPDGIRCATPVDECMRNMALDYGKRKAASRKED